MLTLYNIGDFVGKKLSDLSFLSIHMIYGIIALRCVFFVTFLMTMHKSSITIFDSDIFAYSNMLLFSTTNGFCTGGLMVLGPKRGNDSKSKELIAFIDSFSLTLGIAVGSFIAPSLSGWLIVIIYALRITNNVFYFFI